MPNSAVTKKSRKGQYSTTVDLTTDKIIHIVKDTYKMKKAVAVRMIVNLAMDNKITLHDMKKFYRETWCFNALGEDVGKAPLKLDWTPEEYTVLHRYAAEVLDSDNRSEAFRMLVTYFAIVNDIIESEVVGRVKYKFTGKNRLPAKTVRG